MKILEIDAIPCWYEFSCNNIDTFAQQLTLLAGLAALHDKIRKST